MPIEKKHDKKSKAASIGFRNGLMKDEIVSILHEPGLQELMPEDVKGVLGAELHWAVNYMQKLRKKGRLDTPLPMFEDVRSAEVIGLEEEVRRLKGALYLCQTAVKAAAYKVRQPGYNPKTVIDECLMSVVSNSPTFMGEQVPEPEDKKEG